MCIAYYGEKKRKTLVAYSVELPTSWDSYLLLFQSQSHVRFSSPNIFYLSPYQSDNKNTSTILTQRSNLLTQTPEGKNKNAVIDSHNIHFTYSVPSWFSSLAVSLFQEASAKCPALHRYNPHACRRCLLQNSLFFTRFWFQCPDSLILRVPFLHSLTFTKPSRLPLTFGLISPQSP